MWISLTDPPPGRLFLLALQGDLHDHQGLVKVIKQVDVVISTVGAMQLADQAKLVAAIKEAGNVKVASFFILRIPMATVIYLCSLLRTLLFNQLNWQLEC